MTSTAKQVLERVASWPEADQEELAEMARNIEARRTGVYVVDEAEEAAIREAIREFDRGDWVDEKDMTAFWKRCGVL
jgi:hypothetical protein